MCLLKEILMNAKMCENEKAVCGNEKAIIEKHNRILSTISHDLKSPMVALLGFSRILFGEIEASNANHRWLDMLKIIIDSGEDMFGLIEDILAMAKMEAGKEIVEFELIEDLAKELDGIKKPLVARLRQKELICLSWLNQNYLLSDGT